jgi:hypothetical protein
MEHAEAHERLSDLALEPGRLAGLEADSSAGAAELRAHLASCERCRADLAGWRRTWAEVARVSEAGDVDELDHDARPGARHRLAGLGDHPLIRPPAALRSRILAGVGAPAERGDPIAIPVARSDADDAANAAGEDAGLPGATDHNPRGSRLAGRLSTRTIATPAWMVAVAAVIIALTGATAAWLQRADLDRVQAEHAELAGAAATIDRVLTTEPSWRVTLRTADGTAGGTLAWSTREVVVIASALPVPGPGQAYRCWLERDGTRTPMGWMTFSRSIGYWSGPLSEYGPALQAGGRFGVSLVPAGGNGTPVLVGEL